jgi:hypothetical protein
VEHDKIADKIVDKIETIPNPELKKSCLRFLNQLSKAIDTRIPD